MPTSLERPTQSSPTIRLIGTNLEVMRCQSEEVLVEGPSGTGKSLTWLLKWHYLAEHVPGVRLLIMRKVRASLAESALVTFERDILGPGHPLTSGRGRATRQSYNYPNGSVIVLGGMDKPDKILSTEWDGIYAQEATELELVDWETLGGRLRSNVLPFQQLAGDCNPNAPGHFLNQRFPPVPRGQKMATMEVEHEGEILRRTRILSQLEDNAGYFDVATGELNQLGRRYLGRLKAGMTGHRYQRFVQGIWAAASGAVYDCFERRPVDVVQAGVPGADWQFNTCQRFPIPAHWTLSVGVDFGIKNAAFVLFAEERSAMGVASGRLFVIGSFHSGTNMSTAQRVGELRSQWRSHGSRAFEKLTGWGGNHQEQDSREAWGHAGCELKEPELSNQIMAQVQATWDGLKRRDLIVFEDQEEVIGQFDEMRWDERAGQDKILDIQKFHLLDAIRYRAPAAWSARLVQRVARSYSR